MTPALIPITPETHPVLLYDGECGLCNGVVRFLLRLDRTERLNFSTLQGTSGQTYLKSQGLPAKDFDTLVFIPDWSRRNRAEYLLRTDGALAALRACGGLGAELAAVGSAIPARWRDAGYRAVSRWRYRLFGEYRPRPLARPEWAVRFLP